MINLEQECWTLISAVVVRLGPLLVWSIHLVAIIPKSSTGAQMKFLFPYTRSTTRRGFNMVQLILLAPLYMYFSFASFNSSTDTLFWGAFKKMEEAMEKNADVDVLINFASLRSAFESTIQAFQFPQVSTKIL